MPFQPGQSGNPGGRPRAGHALAEAVRRQCDPDELIAIALSIARGPSKNADRLAALAWLSTNGYIAPPKLSAVDARVAATITDAGPALPDGWRSMPAAERAAFLDGLTHHLLPAGTDEDELR